MALTGAFAAPFAPPVVVVLFCVAPVLVLFFKSATAPAETPTMRRSSTIAIKTMLGAPRRVECGADGALPDWSVGIYVFCSCLAGVNCCGGGGVYIGERGTPLYT